jgi:hypothetical protein
MVLFAEFVTDKNQSPVLIYYLMIASLIKPVDSFVFFQTKGLTGFYFQTLPPPFYPLTHEERTFCSFKS